MYIGTLCIGTSVSLVHPNMNKPLDTTLRLPYIRFIFSFAKDEKLWMERLLKRQKLDAEGQANIVLLQEDANFQMRPRQLFASGYPGETSSKVVTKVN